MAISDNDSKKIAQQILGALESLIKRNSRTVGGGTKVEHEKSAKSTNSLNFDATKKSLKDLNKTVADITKEMEQLSAGTKGSSDKFKELAKSQTALFEGLVNNEALDNKAQDSILKRIKKNLESQTLLGKQLGESINSIKDLGDALKESTDYLSDYNSALEDAGTSTLNEIKNKKKLVAAISSLSKNSKEYSTIQKLLASGTKKSIEQAAKMLDEDAKSSAKFRDSTLTTIKNYASLEAVLIKMKAGVHSVANVFGGGWVKEMATGLGSLLLVISGAQALGKQFWSISQIGLAGHFLSISKGSISLGIDLETFGRIIRKSNVAIGQLGFDRYKNIIKQNQISLRSLGLSAADSASGISSFVDNALSSGVDIRNKQDLDNAIKKQTDAFSTLVAVTGESIDEFNKNNKQIFDSASFQQRYAGLDKTRRKNILLNIVAERKRLAVMGLSSETQLSIIKKTQDILGNSVTDRFTQSANLMQAAIVSGNADSANEIRNIFLKGDRASGKDKSRLSDLLLKVNKDLNGKRVSGNLNQENLVNKTLKDNESVLGAFTKANNEKHKNKLTKNELINRKAAQVVNKNIVKISQGMDQLQQILKNPLIRISAGVAGILFLLSKRTRFGKNLLNKKASAKIPSRSSNTSARVNKINKSSVGGYRDRLKSEYAVNPEPVRRTNSKGRSIYYGSEHPVTGKAVGKQISRDEFYKRKASNIKSRTTLGTIKRAGNVTKSAIGMPLKGLGKAAGIVGRGALKFLPVVGWAIAGMEAIKGSFDAVDKAASIFHVDTKKRAVTTSEKISAGIAGALSTLSFGLIPTEGTATILNTITNASGKKIHELFTGTISTIGDAISASLEYAVSGLVPNLWGGFKWALGAIVDNIIAVGGYLKDGIISIFNGDYFAKIFLGKGEGGVVSNIIRSFGKAMMFLSSSLIRGLTRVGLDAVGYFANLLGFGDKFKKLTKKMQDFASADVKFSDFDSAQEKKARKKSDDAKKYAKQLAAIRNKTNKSVDKIMNKSHSDTVKSLKLAATQESNILGSVKDFNTKLTKSQLLAQGVIPARNKTIANTQGVKISDGNITHIEVPKSDVVKQKNNSASATTRNTTINNVNNVADVIKQTENKKSVGLSDVVDAVNRLISLQEDELALSKNMNEVTRLSALDQNAFAPSASSSLDNKIV